LIFRCVDAEAYEVKEDNLNNGIFISFLKQRVCEDEKVTVMLDRVAEGIMTFKKQFATLLVFK
jgi:mucosa-associated lymphoid tissue lymphoma translocation protein 1